MEYNDILKSPCVFCGYNGEKYWQKHSHPEYCPLSEIGGEEERAKKMAEILEEHTKKAMN